MSANCLTRARRTVCFTAIDGPKAVGKTTTAEQRVLGLLRLDSRANRVPIEADPELVRTRVRPLLIDEWQKVPEVWDVVRRVVDEDPAGGQFLLVGSAAPAPGPRLTQGPVGSAGSGCVR